MLPKSRPGASSWPVGLILETALDAGATTLLTEDLQHGQVVGTLRVHNPFLAS